MFKRMIATLGLILLISVPINAMAHSVDSGEIRWGTHHGSTYWTTERNAAISTWNALGKIKILGDTTTTIEDLSFKDVSISWVDWAGLYTEYAGIADKIEINNAAVKESVIYET